MNQTMRGGDLARYQAFLAVFERGSFARAAAQLGMSAPALSQSIRALEEQLGVQLLRRTTRSVTPTEQGQAFEAKLRPLLRELGDVVAAARETDGPARGTVRLNVPHTAAAIIGSWIGPFGAKHPEIVLDVTVDDSLADIVAGRFDAGIRLGERLARDMVAVALGGPLQLAAVAAPAYLKKHGTPQTPRDLEAHRCINIRMLTHGDLYRWEFERRGRALEVSVQGPLTVTSPDLALRGALEGVGIAYLFDDLVMPHVRARRLVRVLESWSPSFPGLHLYYPKHRHAPPALKAFITFVREAERARRAKGKLSLQ